MKLIEGTGSRLENETVIVFNESEDEALITTASPVFFRKLTKMGFTPASYISPTRPRFLIPKALVSVRRGRKAGKPMSEERKAMLRKAREGRLSGVSA